MGEPVFLALLTADKVITEKNEKKGIIGTFNRLGASKFPATFQTWWIYASATNLVGEHDFRIDIVGDDTSGRLFSATGTVNIESTSRIVEIAVPIVACSFPNPGSYTVLFMLDDYQLGARVVRVDRVTKTTPPSGETS